jgi:SH3-like domain-containing protein
MRFPSLGPHAFGIPARAARFRNQRKAPLGDWRVFLIAFTSLALLGGCSRFKTKPPEQYVYVTARQTYLRDRVAAVSNRTGTVENGQRLTILERGRRFLRVRADSGETGWIDERTVATQQTFDAFAALAQNHASDPAVASAVVRDEVYLHLNPGRSTERFYRLAEGDKLSLLKRATLPRGGGPNPNAKPALARNPRQAAIPGAATGLPAAPKPETAAPTPTPAAKPPAKATANAATPSSDEPAAPPPMEDWWLVRDAHGHTGWLLSRLMDVDAPDSVARYSEGQRIVGAYVLTKVDDPDAPQDDKSIPIYVTVLSPYKAGLPYDFDQVRVFTWNVKKHRYETAFREKNIEGYLPVEIKMVQDTGGKAANAATPLPGFTYKVLPADAAPVIPDPETGAIVPGPTIAKTYRLEGNILHRILPPGTTAPDELHPEIVPDKKDKKKAKKR